MNLITSHNQEIYLDVSKLFDALTPTFKEYILIIAKSLYFAQQQMTPTISPACPTHPVLTIGELYEDIRAFMTTLDSIIEIRNKFYIAYKKQGPIFLTIKKRKNSICLFFKENPHNHGMCLMLEVKNMTEIGHLGTCNHRISLKTSEEFEKIKTAIQFLYNRYSNKLIKV